MTTPPSANDASAGQLQNQLVEQLKLSGHLRDPRVEAAFRAVPRHIFLPDVPLEDAYRDEAIATKREAGRAISSSSQPAIMAIMLEQLALEPGQRVLEIGAGTGYNAALMAHIVGETGEVISIDIDQDIVESARRHLAAAGYERVRLVCADGGYGWPEAAPYDRIILTVGAADITPAWREQLKPAGRLVMPLSLKGSQESIAFIPAGDHLASTSVVDCGFMMLRGEFAEAEPLIPIGPEPGLYLRVSDPASAPVESVFGWLSGPYRDWPAPVSATTREVWRSLALWLALHEPDLCGLSAEGVWVERRFLPCLLETGGRWPWCFTSGLLSPTGLSVLSRPPDTPDSYDDVPLDLSLRAYGADGTLVARLMGDLLAWDRAGRPSSEGLRVRAYPAAAPLPPSAEPAASAAVIVKRWTRFVVDWPGMT